MTTTLLNLTPHEVILETVDRGRICLGPSDRPVRLESTQVPMGEAGGVIVMRNTFTAVNVPEPRAGVVFIVSTIAAMYLQRPDVVAPNGLDCEKNSIGRTVAVRSLQSFCPETSEP